jgi:NADPH:quinone reductase-like Zn-dependent oxidoreductase
MPTIDFVRVLGGEQAVDDTQEDFADAGEVCDFIVDILGECTLAQYRRVLKPNGRSFFVSLKMKQLAQMRWTFMVGNKKLSCVLSSERVADLHLIRELIEAGKIKAVIDRCYPLE